MIIDAFIPCIYFIPYFIQFNARILFIDLDSIESILQNICNWDNISCNYILI